MGKPTPNGGVFNVPTARKARCAQKSFTAQENFSKTWTGSYSDRMNEADITEGSVVESGGPSRDERRVRAALDVLRTAIRDQYLAQFGAQETLPASLSIHLQMTVRPRENWSLDFVPAFHEQVIPQLSDAEAAREVFTVGRIYCFRCESSVCEHGAPQHPLQVFRGYDATGRPEWHELTQALIDDKVERVELLFAPKPKVVAHFQPGRQLKGRQLSAFGKSSLSYSVLGQVIAGYLDLRGERAAVTLQLIEGRGRDGRLRLRLNPIAFSVDEHFLMEWLTSGTQSGLLRALQLAEREVHQLEQQVIAARERRDQESANQQMGRVPAILRRLAETIERGGRQEQRRTRHVETRREEQRPVHKAFEDATRATPDQCFYDAKARTFVVVGDRGRAHAFSAAGRHVTSFVVKPSAVAFRVRTERWRPVTAAEWADVRPALQPRATTEETPTHESA